MVNGIDNVMIVSYSRPLNIFKDVRIMTIFTAISFITIDEINYKCNFIDEVTRTLILAH